MLLNHADSRLTRICQRSQNSDPQVRAASFQVVQHSSNEIWPSIGIKHQIGPSSWDYQSLKKDQTNRMRNANGWEPRNMTVDWPSFDLISISKIHVGFAEKVGDDISKSDHWSQFFSFFSTVWRQMHNMKYLYMNLYTEVLNARSGRNLSIRQKINNQNFQG